MDEEAWQGPRSCCGKKSTPKGQRVFFRAWFETFFALWRQAVSPDSEQRRQELLWDVEGLARLNLQIAWCRYGTVAQAKAARDATWKAKQRWMEGQADSMARLQETGDWAATWSAVRKLVGRKKRSFRPPVPMLGDDGKPLASLQAKANQHQREFMKEFGENCEHLVRVQADKQAAPVLFTSSPKDTCALPGTEREWEDALHVLSKLKSGRAFGPDAIRALGDLYAKVVREGAPMLWKGGEMTAVPRKPGPLTPNNTRGVLCSSCPGKMYASVLRAAAVPWLPMSAGMSQTGAVRGGGTEFAINHGAQPCQFLGSDEKVVFRRHPHGHSQGLLLRSC